MKGRPRKMRQFMVLVMLLYGKYPTMVVWSGPRTCRVRTTPFGKHLGMDGTRLKSCFEWLKRQRYLSELDVLYGYCELKIAEPLVRSANDEEVA